MRDAPCHQRCIASASIAEKSGTDHTSASSSRSATCASRAADAVCRSLHRIQRRLEGARGSQGLGQVERVVHALEDAAGGERRYEGAGITGETHAPRVVARHRDRVDGLSEAVEAGVDDVGEVRREPAAGFPLEVRVLLEPHATGRQGSVTLAPIAVRQERGERIGGHTHVAGPVDPTASLVDRAVWTRNEVHDGVPLRIAEPAQRALEGPGAVQRALRQNPAPQYVSPVAQLRVGADEPSPQRAVPVGEHDEVARLHGAIGELEVHAVVPRGLRPHDGAALAVGIVRYTATQAPVQVAPVEQRDREG